MIRLWWALVRFGFRLLYNEMAFTYDTVSRLVSFGQWRAWQRGALPYLTAGPDDPVLELAHGTGNLQIDLRRHGYHRVLGLDLSAHMGHLARRKLRRYGFRPRLVRASAPALPFPDAAFTNIISTFPTNFILMPETLREVARVLRPGGRLIIGATGRITGTHPLARLLEFAYRVTGQRGSDDMTPVMDAFEAAGLSGWHESREIAGGEVWVIVAEKL